MKRFEDEDDTPPPPKLNKGASYWFGKGSSTNPRIEKRVVEEEVRDSTDWCTDQDPPSKWANRRSTLNEDRIPIGAYVARINEGPTGRPLTFYQVEMYTPSSDLYNIRKIDGSRKLKTGVNIFRYKIVNEEFISHQKKGYVWIVPDRWSSTTYYGQRVRWSPVRYKKIVVFPLSWSLQKEMTRLKIKNDSILKRQERVGARWRFYWKSTLVTCLRIPGFIRRVLKMSSNNERLGVVIGVALMNRSSFKSIQWRRLFSKCVSDVTVSNINTFSLHTHTHAYIHTYIHTYIHSPVVWPH